jgi:hypothetical protein
MQNLLESSSDSCDFVMQACQKSEACQGDRTRRQEHFNKAETADAPRPTPPWAMGPSASNMNAMEKFLAHQEIGFVLTM